MRDALDTGSAIDDSVSVVSVGATLIELLRSLDDSVVPAALFPHSEFHSVPVAVWYVLALALASTCPRWYSAHSSIAAWCTCVTGDVGPLSRCRNLLQKLDVASYNTFTYVICFARELLAHSSNNELTPDVAGTCHRMDLCSGTHHCRSASRDIASHRAVLVCGCLVSGTAEVFGKALLRPPMADDMDAVATAAGTMTSAPASAALRSAGTSGSVSAVLAELLMTPAQLSAVREVMQYFLTWTPGSPAVAGSSSAANAAPAHDPNPLTTPPPRPSTPVAVASDSSDGGGFL